MPARRARILKEPQSPHLWAKTLSHWCKKGLHWCMRLLGECFSSVSRHHCALSSNRFEVLGPSSRHSGCQNYLFFCAISPLFCILLRSDTGLRLEAMSPRSHHRSHIDLFWTLIRHFFRRGYHESFAQADFCSEKEAKIPQDGFLRISCVERIKP